MWIYRRRGGVTAKRLAEMLDCRVSKVRMPKRHHFVINYGQRCGYANLNRNVIFNKLEAHFKLQNAEINVPKVYLPGEEIPDSAFPLLARKAYHSQGRDVIYIHNREQLENDVEDFMYDYLIEYINKTSEYRVHILKDFGEFVSVKFNDDGQGDPLVRSHRNGWRQIEYDKDWKDSVIELAQQAIDALGYDFGAVDIIRRRDKLYVLEVNSSPGLEDRKLQLYADYFKQKELEWRQNAI
jgi:glutathione synthase/RimK-type ligase-like ATP-grasp enzyme